MPTLPAHLFLGRSTTTGPVIGCYVMIPFGPFTIAASQTDLVQCAKQLPYDFRLERIAGTARVKSTAVSLKFYSGATRGALTTNLISAANLDLAANGTFSILPSGETSVPSGTTLSTVAGVRDLAKGTFINLAGTTDATAGGTIDVNIQLFGFITGHPNVDPAND